MDLSAIKGFLSSFKRQAESWKQKFWRKKDRGELASAEIEGLLEMFFFC